MTGYEKETIISYNQAEPTATIFTYHPALIRKLDRLCAACDGYRCLQRGEAEGAPYAEYEIPKKYVSIRKPANRAESKATSENREFTAI